MKQQITKAVKKWLKDYEAATGQSYGDSDTIEGSAYIIFNYILVELRRGTLGSTRKVTGKLKRDKVISIVKGQDLVGVYWDGTNGSDILFETSPAKADAIIRLFNNPINNPYKLPGKELPRKGLLIQL